MNVYNLRILYSAQDGSRGTYTRILYADHAEVNNERYEFTTRKNVTALDGLPVLVASYPVRYTIIESVEKQES